MEKDEIAFKLGEIHGTLQAIQKNDEAQTKKIDRINSRITSIEVKSAANGATAGGIIAVAIEAIKQSLGIGGA